MSRKQLKRTLLMGAGCAVFLLAGIVYSRCTMMGAG